MEEKMKNKAIMSIFILATMALLSVGMVSAFQGSGQGMMKNHFEGLLEEEQAGMLAYQESIQESVENNDFVLWKSLMESKLTQDNFDKMVERQGEMSEMRELKEQMTEAWENEDYETLEELSEDLPEETQRKRQMNGMHDFGGEKPEKDKFFHKLRFW